MEESKPNKYSPEYFDQLKKDLESIKYCWYCTGYNKDYQQSGYCSKECFKQKIKQKRKIT